MAAHVFRAVVFAAATLASTATASAEIVFFASGRTLSVKGHRDEGGRLVLIFPGGGEVTCDRALVARIVPDEIPTPEPSTLPPAGPPVGRASNYDSLIEQSALRHGVSVRLVKAVIQVESAYQAGARSHKGAMGLMQLMPGTAQRFAVHDPYDPGANIEGGIKYLKVLLDRFEVSLALAAYNAGEAAVERFGGIPPYAETRNYVASVLKLAGLSQK